ncbi:IclR family transcriptional regulator [Pseudomonas fluorescens]|uniref:HTH-type transcriptional repressor AllR n=1 Tax=Pseudomonas fluorescens TaxID=294 RepID=A0A327N6K2_PSEFL|nr:IclR family transcriptional regulator C-terminal domain-containing protein [Pseudomonas fluorescens]RAI70877.1 IclR family transcriptional regulator [Pseudomonas fluorescens]
MLEVLEKVAQEGPISVADVAKTCNINRTVAHRLLSTLAGRSFVRKTERGYALGFAIPRLNQLAGPSLQTIARPYMAALVARCGESVSLHGLDGKQAVVLDQVVGGGHLVQVQHTPGSHYPAYLGASGLALLAYQPQLTIERVLEGVSGAEEVTRRLEGIRSTGFAHSHDELQSGVHAIAAPLLDSSGTCRGSLALFVPTIRSENILQFRDDVIHVAEQIVGSLDAE